MEVLLVEIEFRHKLINILEEKMVERSAQF